MLSIKVPPLGESITEATVSRWLRNEGDAVTAGETLVELETDKITVEVPALKAGVLTNRSKAEGDVVAVNDTLGEMDETATAAPRAAAAPRVVPAAPPANPAVATPAIPTTVPVAGVRAAMAVPPASVPPALVFIPAAPVTRITPAIPVARVTPVSPIAPAASMPAARRLSVEFGIDLTNIAGTARGGVVSKPDVIAALSGPVVRVVSDSPDVPVEPATFAAPAAVPMPAAAAIPPSVSAQPAVRRPPSAVSRETREKMSTRRKRIAENLLLAQHATAHLTTFNEIDMSAIVALRERLKDKVEKAHGVKLSFMPFFAKAAIMALKAFPVVNAQIDGDSIVYKNYVNLGIAVASDAGLVVPNVKDADALGILGLSQEIAAIAKRARDGKLTMDDLTAGTFTITNGGVFGSLISTPIINYPQSAILGLHKMQDRPVADDGQVTIRPMMFVALSYDHRIIDGQQAVLYLVKVKELMEDPASMLID